MFEKMLIATSRKIATSQVVMEFRRPDDSCHTSVLLPRRSVAVLTEEARYRWTHGITPRKSDIVPTTACTAVELGEEGTVRGNGCEGGLSLMKRGTRTSFTFRQICQQLCNCGGWIRKTNIRF